MDVINFGNYKKFREEYGESIAKLIAKGIIRDIVRIKKEPKFWDINPPDFDFISLFLEFEIEINSDILAKCNKGKIIYDGFIEYPYCDEEWVNFFVRIFQIYDGSYIIYDYSACLIDEIYDTTYEEEYDVMYHITDKELIDIYIKGCEKVGYRTCSN